MLKDRITFYKELEERRNSKLMVYVTSDRPNLGTQIASDILSPFTEHLDKIGDVEKISLYIYTRGGNTLAAWTLVNLIRNFCKDFEVIIPFNCHSAGTLISLGANRIIMTKQATLGPIDPSVNGPLNPQIPGTNNPNAKVPISVEFVDAYLQMAKSELGIKDQIGLANILIDLSKHIHPLTLGQVYKSKAQIQMLADKLLEYHEIKIENKDAVIKFLCSESGSHDYTMHRNEAKKLGLNIEKPDMELYKCIKNIYDDLESELQLRIPFDPNVILGNQNHIDYQLRRALIESIDYGCDVFVSEGKLNRQTIQTPPNNQQTIIQDNRTFEGWKKELLD
ncbi:hypothetical protein ACE01N_00770 [Saccharicrinis sp. FJH2]|uniref:SDH family Clp fold serine proteinase n=1 Tax=Saccharicrinis sp. FJH65 TaxID=3344659 RepID=UPI0035F3E3AC